MSTARLYGGRAAAIALPLLLLGILWAVLVAPLAGMASGFADERDAITRQIAAERRDIAAGPAWQAALSRLAAQDTEAAGARPEPSEALAEAGLQNDVQQIIAGVGGQIVSAEPLPAAQQGDFQAISLRVALTLPAPAVAALLRGIETRTPFMFITAASFATQDPGYDPDAGSAAAPMNVQLTIVAYRRP